MIFIVLVDYGLLLKYFGHEKVSVLDGGMKKWLNENRPTDNKINQDLGKFSSIDKLNPKKNTLS